MCLAKGCTQWFWSYFPSSIILWLCKFGRISEIVEVNAKRGWGKIGACRKVKHESRYSLDQISGLIFEGAEPFLAVIMSVIINYVGILWHC